MKHSGTAFDIANFVLFCFLLCMGTFYATIWLVHQMPVPHVR